MPLALVRLRFRPPRRPRRRFLAAAIAAVDSGLRAGRCAAALLLASLLGALSADALPAELPECSGTDAPGITSLICLARFLDEISHRGGSIAVHVQYRRGPALRKRKTRLRTFGSLSRDRPWDGQIARPYPSGYPLTTCQVRHFWGFVSPSLSACLFQAPHMHALHKTHHDPHRQHVRPAIRNER